MAPSAARAAEIVADRLRRQLQRLAGSEVATRNEPRVIEGVIRAVVGDRRPPPPRRVKPVGERSIVPQAGAAMVTRDGWKVEGDALVRELQMRDFDEAFGIVTRIAAAAEDHFRRPDMCISEFNRVRIIVANPHHAGITEAERRLAAKVDAVVGGV